MRKSTMNDTTTDTTASQAASTEAQAGQPLADAITEASGHPHCPTCVSQALSLIAAELAEVRALLG